MKITIAIYLSTIILGLVFKRSSICTAYIFLAMSFLAIGNNMNADYEAYSISYMKAATDSEIRYIGYSFILRLFNKLGFSFPQYRAAFFVVCFLLLVIAIGKLTIRVNYVLALYMVFAFPMDVVQMKTFISEVLVILGMAIYFDRTREETSNGSDKGVIIEPSLLLIIAALLHLSNLYFLIAFWTYFLLNNKAYFERRLLEIAIPVSFLVYFGLLAKVLNLLGSIGLVGGLSYLAQWTQRNTHFGFVLSLFLLGLVILAAGGSSASLYDLEKNCELDIKLRRFISTSLLLAPFLVLDVTYLRLLRVYMILLCILYANKEFENPVKSNELVKLSCFYFSIFYAFAYEVLSMYEGTLGAIMHNNSLIQ